MWRIKDMLDPKRKSLSGTPYLRIQGPLKQFFRGHFFTVIFNYIVSPMRRGSLNLLSVYSSLREPIASKPKSATALHCMRNKIALRVGLGLSKFFIFFKIQKVFREICGPTINNDGQTYYLLDQLH